MDVYIFSFCAPYRKPRKKFTREPCKERPRKSCKFQSRVPKTPFSFLYSYFSLKTLCFLTFLSTNQSLHNSSLVPQLIIGLQVHYIKANSLLKSSAPSECISLSLPFGSHPFIYLEFFSRTGLGPLFFRILFYPHRFFQHQLVNLQKLK